MKALKSFFNFYRRERNGILVLFVCILSIQLYLYFDEYGVYQEAALIVDTPPESNKSAKAYKLFYFDPNHIEEEQAALLGISKKQFNNLSNYRKAGGRFVKAKDLSKLYTFDEVLCEQLIPYIRFSHNTTLETLEVNTASAADFQQFKGIGTRLSQRIVRFRDALGGFVDKEQLYEVYGLNDSLVARILPKLSLDLSRLKYIALNEADEARLKRHPYISKEAAKKIISYRTLHGNFHNADEIDKIKGISQKRREKIKPYLRVK